MAPYIRGPVVTDVLVAGDYSMLQRKKLPPLFYIFSQNMLNAKMSDIYDVGS